MTHIWAEDLCGHILITTSLAENLNQWVKIAFGLFM